MREPTAGRATLAVLGAGPKGLAIAAKRAALARSGGEVPDLVLVDREGVAANWSGAAGYTDGRQRLSTAPEKDVGRWWQRSGTPGRRRAGTRRSAHGADRCRHIPHRDQGRGSP
jgi:hypothetical protein